MSLHRRLFAVWLVLLSTIGISHSCIITHFDVYEEEDVTRLRVVSFNSKTQKLLHHETMNYEVFDKPLSSFLSQFHSPEPKDPELSYRVKLKTNGNFKVRRPAGAVAASREKYMIVAEGSILNNHLGTVAFAPSLQKNYWLSAALPNLSPNQISALVPALKAKEPVENFAIVDPFTVRNQLRQLGTAEKGDLGELLTVLCAFSFGYETLESKYEGNHGLDGLFRRNDNNFLIISQTKAGDSNDRAKTVMAKELNEKHMSERLQRMLNSGLPNVIASANVVLTFLRETPARVFKMSHCLLDKGKAQLYIQPVEVGAFPETGPVKLFNAAQADKQTAVRKKVESFAPDLASQLRLTLSSLPLAGLPQQDALRIMMEALQISDEKQDQIIEVLDEDE